MQSSPVRKGIGLGKRGMVCVAIGVMCLVGACRNLEAEQIVRYEFSSEERDAQLEDILYLSIGVRLARAGFSSTRTAERAPYLLRIAYVSRFAAADVSLTLESAGLRDRILGETKFRLVLDYDLDAVIATAIDELLQSSGILSPDGASAQEGSAIQGLLTAPSKVAMSPDELLAATALRFSAAVALGGMVVVGDLTDYFRYGVSGMAGFSARLPRKEWSFSLGVRVLGTRLINDEGVSGGPLYLSSVGVDAQFGTGYKHPYRLSAAASCGLAVLSVADGGETLHSSVPYADAGITYQLPLGSSLFAGLDIRYLVAFDSDHAIMGVVPLLTVRKEFR